MNPDLLAIGFLEYVVFLFSTTCHEAAHALVAVRGGDVTALEAGQVSLSPLPHIRREPFGMVIMPLIGILTGSGLIGWASAPYNPKWAAEHPKRAALMSAAGPVANFTLALIAAVIMRLGLAIGIFEPSPAFFTHMVGAAQPGGVMDGVAAAVSILFSLNILLGVFNLLPIPPLDGYGVLGLFVSPGGAIKLQQLRFQMRTFAIIGLVLAWQLFDHIFPPVFAAAGRMLYYGYRFS